MPLIILTGYPCSGKTERAQQLLAGLTSLLPPGFSAVHVPSTHSVPHAPHTRDEIYTSSKLEKDARAAEYSAIKRALGKDRIVIADGLNYIKGYRYQLWCEAKAVGTGCCVVHVAVPGDVAEGWNEARRGVKRKRGEEEEEEPKAGDRREEAAPAVRTEAGGQDPPRAEDEAAPNVKTTSPANNDAFPSSPPTAPPSIDEDPYSPSTFSALTFRYEEPLHTSRWDTPLFTVLHTDDAPPIRDIFDALVLNRRAVKPHAATVAPPPTAADALQVLEESTQEVVRAVAAWGRENGDGGGIVDVGGERMTLEIPPGVAVGLPKLQRLRRQFVGIQRASVGGQGVGGLPVSEIKGAFVRFLDGELAGGG